MHSRDISCSIAGKLLCCILGTFPFAGERHLVMCHCRCLLDDQSTTICTPNGRHPCCSNPARIQRPRGCRVSRNFVTLKGACTFSCKHSTQIHLQSDSAAVMARLGSGLEKTGFYIYVCMFRGMRAMRASESHCSRIWGYQLRAQRCWHSCTRENGAVVGGHR